MSLIKDLYTLVVKGAYHSINLETMTGLPHFLHDLVLGAKREPKDPNFVYADLHAHFREGDNIRSIVDEASKRVDILAITDKNPERNRGYMNFDHVKEKLDTEQVPHESVGRSVVKVDVNGSPLYLIQAYECNVREQQSVIMLGTDRKYNLHQLSLDDAVNECEDVGAFWFLDHPFSIDAPVIAFRYPTNEEMKIREGWFDKYNPVIEVGNHQNTLWMYPSNILARQMAQKHGLAGIANSDTHFRVKDIGLSRTAFPRDLFDDSSDEAFLQSLRTAFSDKSKLKIESGYASIWSFGTHMILPSLSPKRIVEKLKVHK